MLPKIQDQADKPPIKEFSLELYPFSFAGAISQRQGYMVWIPALSFKTNSKNLGYWGKESTKGLAMQKQREFSFETAFAWVLALLGVVIMGISLSYGFGSFQRAGPGLYPFFIGLFIFISSASLIIKSKLKEPSVPFTPEGKKNLLLMIFIFCTWILTMPILGYIIVTLLVTYLFCRIMKLEGWWKPISVSVCTTLFIYLMFDYWLYIDLPKGILG